eukprot:g68914.t1
MYHMSTHMQTRLCLTSDVCAKSGDWSLMDVVGEPCPCPEDFLSLPLAEWPTYPFHIERCFNKLFALSKANQGTGPSLSSSSAEQAPRQQTAQAQDDKQTTAASKRQLRKLDGDQYLHVLPNKIVLIGLAPSHPIRTEGKEIVSLHWLTEKGDEEAHSGRGKKRQKTSGQKSGKGRRGSPPIHPSTGICDISCSDGTCYRIRSGVYGELVQCNQEAERTPSILTDPCRSDVEGWLALIHASTMPTARTEAGVELVEESVYKERRHLTNSREASRSSYASSPGATYSQVPVTSIFLLSSH